MSEDRKTSLGEFLKSERERRGLTIEQTSSATKIGLKVLKQLEGDRYSELPALPFVRGFIRNYSKFLGIDGEKLLVEYAAFIEEHSRERPKRDAGHSGYAFERPEGEQSKKILWGVMASMLVFGGAVVFIFKPSLKQKHHGHVDKFRVSPTPTPSFAAVDPVIAATRSPTPSASDAIVIASPIPTASPIPVTVAEKTPPSAKPSPETPFIPPKTPLVLAPPEVKTPRPSPSPTVVVAVATAVPSPTPVPKPTLTIAATAAPSPASVVSPTPEPSVSPTASASVAIELDPAEDQKKDPLQSGTNYPSKEIKYKLIFRTKADVWVRYQCDDKKMMKFVLRAGKILVLRGKRIIRFQASNPRALTVQLAGGQERLLADSPSAFDYQGNPTLVLPLQEREKIGDSFNIGGPLPPTEDPVSTDENLTNGPTE
jgi:cytoskeleton protein RodZ